MSNTPMIIEGNFVKFGFNQTLDPQKLQKIQLCQKSALEEIPSPTKTVIDQSPAHSYKDYNPKFIYSNNTIVSEENGVSLAH